MALYNGEQLIEEKTSKIVKVKNQSFVLANYGTQRNSANIICDPNATSVSTLFNYTFKLGISDHYVFEEVTVTMPLPEEAYISMVLDGKSERLQPNQTVEGVGQGITVTYRENTNGGILGLLLLCT